MRANHADIWGRNSPGRENSKFKGPEVGMCMLYVRNKEVSMARRVYFKSRER